jgi:hypothetical protein
MKKATLALALLLTTGTVTAGSCGVGKITEILEGHWNTNYFAIKIDYSNEASSHPETNFHSEWITFRRGSINQRRYEGIRELARLAFVHNYTTSTYSHNDDCSDSTFLGIYK